MKMHFVLLLGVCFHLCFAQSDFESFQLKYKKTYLSQEATLRQQIFNSNLAKIEEHNKLFKQGLVSFEMGVNQFSDLTEQEFSSKFNTWQLDETLLKNAKKQDTSQINVDDLSKSVDWRKAGVVTPVKDQGNCGGCWTFSATGTLEGQLAIIYGNLTSLSEQQLLDCTTVQNHGCDGGVVQYAIDYVVKHGLTTESQYPYKHVRGVCDDTKPVVIGAKGYISIEPYNETDLKVAVSTKGPVSVALNASPLQYYSSGIFNATCSDAINHGVLIVGYETIQATGAQYWIIKNSWGSTWGEQGYFRMAMGVGKGLCGIARQACYPYGVSNSTSGDDDDDDDNHNKGNGGSTLWQNNVIHVLGLLTLVIRNIL